jgi:hypothetical protein
MERARLVKGNDDDHDCSYKPNLHELCSKKGVGIKLGV